MLSTTYAALVGRRFDFWADGPRLPLDTASMSTAASPLLPTYARADIAFERGDGVWLTATSGERYLDFGGGVAVAYSAIRIPTL